MNNGFNNNQQFGNNGGFQGQQNGGFQQQQPNGGFQNQPQGNFQQGGNFQQQGNNAMSQPGQFGGNGGGQFGGPAPQEMFIDYNEQPSAGFGLLPNGRYLLEVTAAEFTANAKNNGYVLKLQSTVHGGEYDGRTYFDNFNIQHENQQAQQIGQRDYASLCKALFGEGYREKNPNNLLHRKYYADIDQHTPKKKKQNPDMWNQESDDEKPETRNRITARYPFQQQQQQQPNNQPMSQPQGQPQGGFQQPQQQPQQQFQQQPQQQFNQQQGGGFQQQQPQGGFQNQPGGFDNNGGQQQNGGFQQNANGGNFANSGVTFRNKTSETKTRAAMEHYNLTSKQTDFPGM